MVIHSTLFGPDNHNPRGTDGDPLILPANTANVMDWQDSNGDSYLDINTTTGLEAISFGNAVTNPTTSFLGTGEVKADIWTVRQLASSPANTLLRGKTYGLAVSGVTELHYISSDGTVTQLTGPAAGGNTLDQAYDQGGSHLGRQINVDSGFPVQLTAATSADVALEITGHIAPTHNEIVIGNGAHTTIGSNSVIVGSGARAGSSSVAIGYLNNTAVTNSVGIGTQATVAYSPSIAIGRLAVTTKVNQFMVGGATYYMDEVVIGGSSTSATARTLNFRTTDASTTDVQGWGLDLSAGRGTGSAQGGIVALRTSAPGSTGTTLQPAFHAVGVDPSIAGATPNGEIFTACNEDTDPIRKTHGALGVTASTGTIDIVDLSQHSNNTKQIGWCRAEFTILEDTTTTRDTVFMMIGLVLDSAGALTLGTVSEFASDKAGAVLSTISIDSSSQTLRINWTASTSDTYSIVWSAEWHFGPGTPS
ncbi:MAG: hypothetical protein JKY94_16750 [Rhodobacteraceae bacterium]|nr:hypothetical protein [Paracoccaceae bacterium]